MLPLFSYHFRYFDAMLSMPLLCALLLLRASACYDSHAFHMARYAMPLLLR